MMIILLISITKTNQKLIVKVYFILFKISFFRITRYQKQKQRFANGLMRSDSVKYWHYVFI